MTNLNEICVYFYAFGGKEFVSALSLIDFWDQWVLTALLCQLKLLDKPNDDAYNHMLFCGITRVVTLSIEKVQKYYLEILVPLRHTSTWQPFQLISCEKWRLGHTHIRNIQQYDTEYTTNNFVHHLHNMAFVTNKTTGLWLYVCWQITLLSMRPWIQFNSFEEKFSCMIFVCNFVQHNQRSISNNSLTSCGRPTCLGIFLLSFWYLGGTFPFVPRLVAYTPRFFGK